MASLQNLESSMLASMASVLQSKQRYESFETDLGNHHVKLFDLVTEIEGLNTRFNEIRTQFDRDLDAFLNHSKAYHNELNVYNDRAESKRLSSDGNEAIHFEEYSKLFKSYQEVFEEYKSTFLSSKDFYLRLDAVVKRLAKNYWPQGNVGL